MPGRPPDEAHQLVEEQDEPEGAEHVVEMVAAVEPPHGYHLDGHARDQRGRQGQHDADEERAGQRREGGGEVGAQHVERAVRQVDEVHDAEDQRQAGREQEQQQAELQSVEELLDQQQHGAIIFLPGEGDHGDRGAGMHELGHLAPADLGMRAQ